MPSMTVRIPITANATRNHLALVRFTMPTFRGAATADPTATVGRAVGVRHSRIGWCHTSRDRATVSEYRLEVKVKRWFAVATAASLCLATTGCFHDRSQPQADVAGRLETVAVAKGPPSYFLGRSYAGIDLTTVEPAGSKALAAGERAYFEYGTCEYVDDSGLTESSSCTPESAMTATSAAS